MTSLCGHCGVENEGSPAECPTCGKDPLVGGRFLLLGVLGRGGSGVSWKARRLDIGDGGGELVCLKELRWDRMGSLQDEVLFHREASILQTLDHPNIPRYIDELAWPEEVGPRHALWLAQELVDGVSLEHERTRRRYRTDEVLAIGMEMAETLSYLAERHPPVVHRDVKPSNIMRRSDGALVLVDFGAARASGVIESSGTTVAGTFGFMAPEQLRGVANPGTDVYGLGMTMLVLLAGTGPEALLDDANVPDVTRVANVPQLVRELLSAMLAQSPPQRPSAREVARRIAHIRSGAAPAIRPPRPSTSPRKRTRNFLPLIIGLTFPLIIIGVVVAIFAAVPSPGPQSMPVARAPEPVARAPEPVPVPVPVPEPAVDPTVERARAAEQHLAELRQDIAACPTDREACKRLWAALPRDHDALMSLGLVATFEAACQNGDGATCGLRGTMSLQGDGAPRDAAAGRRFYIEACDKGSVDTCFYSGRMLVDGDGGPIDAKTGVVHLQKACDQGSEAACMNIGVALARGQGIPADRAKALSIFETYCDKNDQTACDNLDGMIGNGWGLPQATKDAKDRFAILARLCDKKVGNACLEASKAAKAGRGTTRDAAVAADYRQRACNFRVAGACDP